jgi:2-haloacid dehalogenase
LARHQTGTLWAYGRAVTDFDASQVRVLALDIFGTTVDWYSGVRDQLAAMFAELGVGLDAGEFASAWRSRYQPSMLRVMSGERAWAYLDTLHRESLDDLLGEHGVALDDASRERAVRAWHALPAWPDTVPGLARLRRRYVVTALSNGGFALLTHLVKAAGLPLDCIVSAELARAYKPDPRPYRTAAALLDVAPGQVLMVAAHGWDLAGAREAGLRTAFVARPAEKGPHEPADRAEDTASDVAATSFTDLADQLGC